MCFDQQLREMLQTPGVCSACVVDWRSGRVLARLGDDDGAGDAVAILRALHTGPPRANQGVEEVLLTDAEHHLFFAVLADPRLCVRVRISRAEDGLGPVLRRLRGLVRTVSVPPPRNDADRPPRRGQGAPRPAARAATPVDRAVLERVLAALRSLSVGGPRPAAV